MRHFRVFPLLVPILLLGARPAQAEEAPIPLTQVIRAARLLDVEAGKFLEGRVVVVKGDRITGVVPVAEAPSGESVRVTDLGDVTLLPGLIDCHTHIVDDAEEYSVAGPLLLSGAQMAFRSIPNARATLMAGFTTIRDLGTYRAFVDVALRDAIEKGFVIGPRIQPAGAYVTMTGGAGSLTGLAADVTLPIELRFGVADGPDQVRQRVRDIVRRGAGVIKVLASGAILTPGSSPSSREFTDEELAAAVDEAGNAGLKVACHAHAAEAAKAAVRAGVASVEHGSMLDDECMAMMKDKGVYLVSDVYDGEADASRPEGYLEEFATKGDVVDRSQRDVLTRAYKAGVLLAFGTDAAVIPHGTNGRQFGVYVECGLAPADAIRTATINAARLMGWDDRVGTLAAGRFADVIAVTGDPLQDVKVLEKPVFVMKGGVVHKGPGESGDVGGR